MAATHYVELRAHSAFSFSDGAVSPERLVRCAAELGYPALGIADTADLGGAIRFALEAESAGIRPVIGAELLVDGHPAAFFARSEAGYHNLAALVTRARVGDLSGFAGGEVDEIEDGTGDEGGAPGQGGNSSGTPRRSTLGPRGIAARSAATKAQTKRGARAQSRCARTATGRGAGSGGDGALAEGTAARVVDGWAAVGKAGPVGGWTGRSRSESPEPERTGEKRPRGRPRISFNQLAEHAAGLHALTGPATGELASLIRAQRSDEAAFALSRWREVFAGHVSVEVQLHHVSGAESALAASLIELAERGGVPWVVTNEPRYIDGGTRLVHDLLTANRAGVDVNTAASWGALHPNGEWRLKSPQEVAQLWQGREAGLEESRRIALDTAFDLRWLRPPLPDFPVPAGDDDSFLARVTFEGAAERWGELDERQRAQLEHELGVIRRLGFSGFFLVMWDAIRFARARGILCQGRGSAANSAVAYCLGITAVDPVRHGLLFERFLSEVRTDGRTEAPDIDVDFEMDRREEVLDYMYAHYRRQHAAITCVTQMYHAPSALQDVMRALGYPAELAFALSKRLHHAGPSEGAAALEDGLAADHGLDLADAKGRAVLSALRSMDDLPRMRSTHPGGFVLSSRPLGAWLPIEHTTMGRTIIQFDKDDLDAAGVPKFDFLGLGGLTAIHLAFDAIEQRTGEKLELYRLPTDDVATYEMIARGDTVGTFQIESRAQVQSILQTRPERLYDIVVQVALIRPGPIQARFVRPYTRRRRGLEPVHYPDARLEPILARTYGIPIFQEQAMAISMALGGFSAAEADELRRSMGHYRKLAKLHAVLERLRVRIQANGVEADIAKQIVEDLHSFANYGFPESHAWSFALIAYATAYLKAHYPAEFFMGLLNAWPMGFYPPATLVHAAIRDGVEVRGPCLRDGAWECTIEPVSSPSDAALRLGALAPGAPDPSAHQPSFPRSHSPIHHPAGAPSRESPIASAPGAATDGSPTHPDEPRPARGDAVLNGGQEPVRKPTLVREPALMREARARDGVAAATHAAGVQFDDSPAGLHSAGTPGIPAPATAMSAGAGALVEGAAARAADGGAVAGKAGPVGGWNGRSRNESTKPERWGDARKEVPALRVGWKHIRGLGDKTRERLQAAREQGPFTSIEDVVKRAQLSRADALHLARAGAFEAFEPGRRAAAWEALRVAGDTLPLAPARALPFDPRELEGEELIFLDYLATGISTHGHPMLHLRARLDDGGVLGSAALERLRDGDVVVVAGLVVARQHPATANGTVFVLLEDEGGFINVIVPKTLFQQNREVVTFSPFLLVEGRFERDGNAMNIVGQRFRRLKIREIAARSRNFH